MSAAISQTDNALDTCGTGVRPLSNSPPARYGLATLICIVIAGMIGAGVFTTSGYSLQSLGSTRLVLLAWATGGIVALCGACAYGELARRMPQSGGEYLYLTKQLHPFAGFLSGWVSLTAGFSGAIAFSAMTCEQYAIPAEVRPEWMPPHLVASLVVVICGLGHSWMQRMAAGIQNAIVIVKLLAISGFILIGFQFLNRQGISWTVPVDPMEGASTGGLYQFASSVMWISLSYAGFNQAVYIASEVREPEKQVPRALIGGTLITVLLYLMLNCVFLFSAPPEQLAGQADIAAISAAAIGGRPLEGMMRAIIATATLSSVASMIMTGPRVYARMADDGVFPSYFSQREGGIHRSVLLQTGLALVLIHSTTLYGLLKYLGVTLSLSSALTVSTLLLRRRSASNVVRAETTSAARRGSRPAAIAYVTATVILATLMAIDNVWQLAGTYGTLLVGGMLWLLLPAPQPPDE